VADVEEQDDGAVTAGGVVRTSEENEALSNANGGKIVQAVGSFTTSAAFGSSPSISKALEDACVAAVEECLSEGITDPDIIKARKAEAMDKVRARLDQLIAEDQAQQNAAAGVPSAAD